jgi:PAS domain S-box-containing protein
VPHFLDTNIAALARNRGATFVSGPQMHWPPCAFAVERPTGYDSLNLLSPTLTQSALPRREQKVRQMVAKTNPDHAQTLPGDDHSDIDSLAIDADNSPEVALAGRARHVDELQLWSDIFHHAAFGISIIDPTSDTIRSSNEALAAMHGMQIDEVQGSRWLDLYAPAERARVPKLLAEATRVGYVDFEADHIRKDNSIFPTRMHITSVSGADGELRYYIATAQDITPERQLKSELEQSSRLEAIGQLTAGIAHDFNNLLQAIMANLELVEDEIEVAPAIRDYVDTALRLAEQGGQLAHDLLAFARKQLLSPNEVDLRDFLNRFRLLLARTLGPRIQIDVTTEAGLAPVWIDARHLQTALLNLALNARDAMPSGGSLRIEALRSVDAAAIGSMGTASHSRRLVQTGHLRRNCCAVIRVSDTGTGIAPQNMARLCEPFFSTKGVNGTGLGLSMVHGFVKQSGGDLLITSEPGKGTCVEVWLPQAPMNASATPASLRR